LTRPDLTAESRRNQKLRSFLWIEKKTEKDGRFIQVALAAADFAIKMSGWKPEDSDLDEVGVYVSSGIGGFDIIEREHSN